MIVRDEEAHLAAAIDSISAVAREVVVVDTGSRDRSKEIARALGARVLSIAWQDDFSLARNAALAAARYDWILSLDADQQLDAASLPALRKAVQRSDLAQLVHVDLMGDNPQQPPVSSFPALRLFRRDERIRFRGRVHEDVAGSLLDIGSTDWPDSGVRLRDTGYIKASERQRKQARNIALLERARGEHPQDLFIAFKLATTLPQSRSEERRKILSQAILVACGLDSSALHALPFRHRLFAEALDDLVEQGHLCGAVAVCRRLHPLLGPGSYFAAGRAFARAGLTEAGTDLLTAYLDLPSHHPSSMTLVDLDASAAEACRWLAWLASLQGQMCSAHAWLERALETASSDQRIAIKCDVTRLNLAAGDVSDVARELALLYSSARNSPSSYAETMLLSGEVSLATGDRAGAIPLLEAAVTSRDDRAAALLAKLGMDNGELGEGRLRELLPSVVGRRFDTLAIRARLAERLGVALDFQIPDAARHYLLAPARTLNNVTQPPRLVSAQTN
jgi:hypothetical protein